MACIDAPTRQRVQKTCTFAAWIATLSHGLRQRWKRRQHPRVPHMNAHIARDIGLSEGDLARRQHTWPSQTTHHPRG